MLASVPPLAWALLVVLAWGVAFNKIQEFRAKYSRGYAERGEFWTRAPTWLRPTESAIWLVTSGAVIVPLALASFQLHHRLRPDLLRVDETAMILIIVGVMLIGIPIAMIFSNAVSWLVPPLRRANQVASEGLPTTTFFRANRGLLTMAALMTPPVPAQILLAAFEPWTR